MDGIFKGVRKIHNLDTYHAISLCTGKLTSLKELSDIIIGLTASNSILDIKTIPSTNEKFDPLPAELILDFKAKKDIKTGLEELIRF